MSNNEVAISEKAETSAVTDKVLPDYLLYIFFVSNPTAHYY